MENLDNTIVNINYIISEKKLSIIYDNNSVEDLVLNKNTFIAIFDKWFIETPVFITDKFKAQIKSLNFVKIDKDVVKNLNDLNIFFGDTDKALKFFNYVRSRKEIIDLDKKKWTKA